MNTIEKVYSKESFTFTIGEIGTIVKEAFELGKKSNDTEALLAGKAKLLMEIYNLKSHSKKIPTEEINKPM